MGLLLQDESKRVANMRLIYLKKPKPTYFYLSPLVPLSPAFGGMERGRSKIRRTGGEVKTYAGTAAFLLLNIMKTVLPINMATKMIRPHWVRVGAGPLRNL